MRLLYNLFFCLFSILYIPSLLIRGKFHRGFMQRFGFLPQEMEGLTSPVWIHAVSVGEAVLAAKLSARIKKVFPEVKTVISTTTRTGNEMVHKYGEGTADTVFYYPLDISGIVRRVVRAINPRLYVMVETELWPNLLEELSRKGVPTVLVNGRISDSSFKGYKKILFITRRILKNIDCFCMQSKQDSERIEALGASRDKIFVTGSMKFDKILDFSGSEFLNKETLGYTGENQIIVAGSTHYPEEIELVDLYKSLREKKKDLRLILAPRHIERVDEIKSSIEKRGMVTHTFSEVIEGEKADVNKCDILLVDTIGHLKDLYSVASVVFIGGSLARRGGQNPIEAARWKKAIVFGPHMSNFREISEVFLENDAARQVKDAKELKEVFEDLLSDTEKNKRLAEAAKKVIESNCGAVDKTADKIKDYIKA